MINNSRAWRTSPNINPVTEHRFGNIKYTKTFLEDTPEVLHKLFAKVIPVRMEYDYTRELFDVTVAFKDFDPVPLYLSIPTYDVIIETKYRKTGGVDPITFEALTQRAIYFTFRKQK
jgi:hypothetical protein